MAAFVAAVCEVFSSLKCVLYASGILHLIFTLCEFRMARSELISAIRRSAVFFFVDVGSRVFRTYQRALK
jgi:hypothetical protein